MSCEGNYLPELPAKVIYNTKLEIDSLLKKHKISEDLCEVTINDGLIEIRTAYTSDIEEEFGDLDDFEKALNSVLRQAGYTNMATLDMGDTSVLYFGPTVPPLIHREGIL